MADATSPPARRKNRQRLLTLNSEGGERHASWLELSFDLVFVLAVAKVAAVLVKESDPVGLVKYVALFVPVWWAWVGYTFYGDRFESDEPEYRILTFAAMLAVAALALTIGGAFTDRGSSPFAVCYALVLLVLCAMYARTAIYVPLARRLSMQFILGFGVAALVFIFSLFLNPPTRYAFWAVGVLIALSTPFLKGSDPQPADRDHTGRRPHAGKAQLCSPERKR